jgi:lactate 2-monooxygenase
VSGQPFGDYYREIYGRGLGGETPSIPVDWAALEERAEAAMEPRAAGYVYAGAGTGATMKANRAAFDRVRIVPRMLRDIADRDLQIELFGRRLPAPLGLAPIGVHGIIHPEGELATARAAASIGLPLVVSSAASRTIEEIAEAGGGGPRWFQLYWPNDDGLARSFVRRAESSGYEAILVTVDTFIPG